jgi:flavin-binding protein dodecin
MMSTVFKSIEMVGVSDTSFDDAARVAVRRAAETIRNLEWMEVVEQRGYIAGGEIQQYQTSVKIWFKLEEGQQPS